MKKILIFIFLFLLFPVNIYPKNYTLSEVFEKTDIDNLYDKLISNYKFSKKIDSLNYIKEQYKNCFEYLKTTINSNHPINSEEVMHKLQEYIVLGGFISHFCDPDSGNFLTFFCRNEGYLYFHKKDENNPPPLVIFFNDLQRLGIINASLEDFIYKARGTFSYIKEKILK